MSLGSGVCRGFLGPLATGVCSTLASGSLIVLLDLPVPLFNSLVAL